MTNSARADRLGAVAEAKRALILDAALRVFARDGLREANMRAIAKEAGYATGAIYGYFPSKEHIYAAALHESLQRLRAATEAAVVGIDTAVERFVAAGLAFFDFYDENPRDLDMGFYLFAGGMAPHGMPDPDTNHDLNAALLATLEPVRAAAEELVDPDTATRLTADAFAHASGLLLLRHTHRINLFHLDARDLMQRYLSDQASHTT
ncbi:TetR/AcrR family transcriptional regulator [Pseudonocardia alni]|uniref:TetR/AcrR family transcriptional regulator n=1 Tax=Pseudonocardia TaxID=1847 RepID=UPI000922CC32|nr:TetR/AcrR family transcriptional regulator [Pseudonocardia sp. SID8383]MYW75165.1 TetR family transcriptional regulator [Pseudonocardia sp. SID8383]OJG04149.1 HTH-type transcriptional repressor KstR [Pseudonocardia autotrophica]